jgi:endonuclease/exonuclease/phosphatase family metal-dependent hydrolase
MLAALPARGGPPVVVVAGDFNDEPTGSTYRLMLENFVDAWAAGAARSAA